MGSRRRATPPVSRSADSGDGPFQHGGFPAGDGSRICRFPTNPGGAGSGQGIQVAPDGSNINPIAIALLQAKNADGTYFIPGSGTAGFQSGVVYSIPAYDKEYQGMLNLDYIVNTKNTLSFKFYRSWEPQSISFSGPAFLPGTPATDPFGYHNMVTRLTTIVNNSLVNELHVSYQRTTTDLFQQPPAQYLRTCHQSRRSSGAKLPGRRIAL